MMDRSRYRSRYHCVFTIVLATIGGVAFESVSGQTSLVESMERLDTNSNGEIDPDEITPLARPFLEQITRHSRMKMYQPIPIDELLEVVQKYYAAKNGADGKDVNPELGITVQPFGTRNDEVMVPEFGLEEIKFPYTALDYRLAQKVMSRSDRNGNGFLDREEIEREDWQASDPYDSDFDGDSRLSVIELTQRYARRRLLEETVGELYKKRSRVGNEIERSVPSSSSQSRSDYRRSRGSSYYLASGVLGRFDDNRNGRLEGNEIAAAGIPVTSADEDRDGELSQSELDTYFKMLEQQSGGDVEGVPPWFFELDVDQDEQVSMVEFAASGGDEKVDEFITYDSNGDGLLTIAEMTQSKALVGGSYNVTSAEMLPPRRATVSEIEIEEDFLIGDLDVKLSITHTYSSHLDIYLVGPDGQQVELCTAVGGSDDNFEQTIFDDQSRYPIVKARAPFQGRFQPEGMLKRQPSLSHFNGKSVQGVWQLVIRTSRSERFGMLHEWSLIVKPQDEMNSEVAAAPPGDGPSSSQSARSSQGAWSNQGSRPVVVQMSAGSWQQNSGGITVNGGVSYQQRMQQSIERMDSWLKEAEAKARNGSDEDRRQFEQKRASIERYKQSMRERMKTMAEAQQ